jgi:hypothetical protein
MLTVMERHEYAKDIKSIPKKFLVQRGGGIRLHN